MKRTMNEYKASMNKIVPSESFISETEALMKKLRDEQNGSYKNIQPENLNKEEQRIDIISNSKTIRIKKLTIGFSAAAAVLVCAVSLNVYNKTNVDTSMTTEVETEVTETTASSEKESPSEEVVSETTALLTEEVEIPALETKIEEGEAEEEIEEIKTDENNDSDSMQTEAVTQSAERKTKDGDFGAIPDESHGVNGANTIDENIGIDENADSLDNSEATVFYYENNYDSSPDGYIVSYRESDDELTENDSEYGTPVWVPNFVDETYDEDYIGSSVYFEDDEGVKDDYYDGEASYSIPYYQLDVSFITALSAADEVYVPDTITDLDAGEYYISAEAGFDEFDEETGILYGSDEVVIDADNLSGNSVIIDKLNGITEGKSQYYYDVKTDITDYRYKITIYSADKSENNAKLFDVMFNKNELVINRYDNGTVSSEKYTINAEEYEELDSFIRSVYNGDSL